MRMFRKFNFGLHTHFHNLTAVLDTVSRDRNQNKGAVDRKTEAVKKIILMQATHLFKGMGEMSSTKMKSFNNFVAQ